MEEDNFKEIQINLVKETDQGLHLKVEEVEVHISNLLCSSKDACQTFNLY